MTIGQALERLQMQCSRSEYCTGQIRRKLHLWDIRERKCGREGFLQHQMDEVVDSLIADKYVDDARFAGAYVRDKARFAKWGPAKIAYNLKMIGVDEGTIGVALDENGELFMQDTLRELAAKKWKSMKGETDIQIKRAKLVRFLVGRGFSYSQIIELKKDLG